MTHATLELRRHCQPAAQTLNHWPTDLPGRYTTSRVIHHMTGLSMLSRREFIAAAVASYGTPQPRAYSETVIDIHQHTNYHGRTDDQLVAHQRTMGVTKTVLLPAGSLYGLAVGAGGNETVVALAHKRPDAFVFFANEVPDLREARSVLEKHLRAGAIGIGEQKFGVACDSPAMQAVAEVAQEFGVPVLMHFQHETYNLGIERFHKMLEKYPRVSFIGHAQTWWGNIDRNHDQKVMYPKGRVTPGGISDRLLSDYPNMYGDLSAGSGLNALLRDEEHAREFLSRHQNKLLYGSDCDDKDGQGDACSGSKCIAAVRRLAPSDAVRRKVFSENAVKLLKIKL